MPRSIYIIGIHLINKNTQTNYVIPLQSSASPPFPTLLSSFFVQPGLRAEFPSASISLKRIFFFPNP
jgi:hypothetical protein